MGMKRRGNLLNKPNGTFKMSVKNRKESFMEKGRLGSNSTLSTSFDSTDPPPHSDRYNYALLIALYTLQGIPMGLSASIPFLIQQKVQQMAAAAAASASVETAAAAVASTTSVSKLSYNANAIFALCSWPFSLKLLWAPIVDAVFVKQFGRRKTWLVPVQTMAGLIMVLGSDFVQQELGLSSLSSESNLNVKGVTLFFVVLYFLMATQDVAVDGWALTLLQKENRGKGPVCNSIGQNLGYFLSFVGFLALNDAESSEKWWRPLLGLKSQPNTGLVSLGGFLKYMGFFMLVVTTYVAIFKREIPLTNGPDDTTTMVVELPKNNKQQVSQEEEEELDAAQLGLRETYHRLYCACQLPAVQWLFVMLLTYRLPTSLSDNVKFLKAVEYGLSKSTTALLSPTVVLPLGILVPIVASKIWHGHPLKQFMAAYKMRVTIVPLLDVCMLYVIRSDNHSNVLFWLTLVASTAMQAIVNSLQFNAQMTFFASRVDPAIGGSYMTLLNTAANLGGTWPASLVMYLVGKLSIPATCGGSPRESTCTTGHDAYFPLQALFSVLGICWIFILGPKLNRLAQLPSDAWRTHLLDSDNDDEEATDKAMLWRRKDSKAE